MEIIILDAAAMGTMSRAEKAARNNALWCDAVCRAHGAPGLFYDSIWINRRVTPPFYPNAVTLTGAADAAAQIAHIETLLLAGIPGEWAVKDSFAALDLTKLGFRLLFEARWLWRPASIPAPRSTVVELRWAVIHDPAELTQWETAWAGETDPIPETRRTFLPELLKDPDIAFMAGCAGQQMIAGAVANLSGGVVGLSNVFAPGDKVSDCWASCVSAAICQFPNLPLVGYEQGETLALAQELGFEALSPLRVWALTNAVI